MRRLAAAVWSGFWLLAMLVAPPWVLTAWFGWPFPRHPPERPYLHEWITASGVLFGWLLWLGLLTIIGVQIIAAVRRIRMPQLRLANPPEGFLTGLIGALVVALTSAASRGTLTALPPAPPVPAVSTPPLSAVNAGTPAHSEVPASPPGRPGPGAKPQPGTPGFAGAGPADGVEPGRRVAPGSVDPWPAATVGPTVPVPGTASGGSGGDRRGGAGPNGGDGAGDGLSGETVPGWHRPAGVGLPDGGWVSHDTAVSVASAAALVWLRRRRRYLPRPPSGSTREDADLVPLAQSVLVVQQAVQEARDDLGEPDTAGDSVAVGRGTGDAVAAAGPGTAAVGQRRDGPLRPADLPAGGVGLVGPGACDAARGILTAVLLSGGPGHPDQDGQVLTTAADLDMLIGAGGVGHGEPPGLSVFTDLDQALTAAETVILHRGQALATAGGGDLPGRFDAAGEEGRFLPVVLLTTCPADPDRARRLAVLTLAPGRLGVSGVLLGAWPHGPTWHVGPDGRTRRDPPVDGQTGAAPAGTGPRLCVLSTAAASDLLTLQAQARPRRYHLPHTGPGRADSGPNRGSPSQAHQGRGDPPGATGTPPRGIGMAPALVHPNASASPAGCPLRLRVLGAVQLSHLDNPAAPVYLRRDAAVQAMVFLAVHPGGVTSGQLAAALWPGVRPYPTGRVYTAVSSLRTAVAKATGMRDVVARVGERYQLDGTRVGVDLWQLHVAAERAAATPDPRVRATALRGVVDIYTGELAAGHHWPWLAPYREATRRDAIDAYATLAATADPPTAATLLDAAMRIDPVNEDLHRRAMRAHAAAGQPDRIAPLLQGLTARLAELDEEPDPDTEQLAWHLHGGPHGHH